MKSGMYPNSLFPFQAPAMQASCHVVLCARNNVAFFVTQSLLELIDFSATEHCGHCIGFLV